MLVKSELITCPSYGLAILTFSDIILVLNN